MPRRGQHDQSPGDGRRPFSDEGGPAGRHASTHDVEREELTRPKGGDGPDEFADDLAPTEAPTGAGGHADESVNASDDKELVRQLSMLDASDMAQLSVLTVGTRLDQGAVYVDLNALDDGPFKAIGGQEAVADTSYVAKRDTDFELWNRLVGQGREPDIERPPSEHD